MEILWMDNTLRKYKVFLMSIPSALKESSNAKITDILKINVFSLKSKICLQLHINPVLSFSSTDLSCLVPPSPKEENPFLKNIFN